MQSPPWVPFPNGLQNPESRISDRCAQISVPVQHWSTGYPSLPAGEAGPYFASGHQYVQHNNIFDYTPRRDGLPSPNQYAQGRPLVNGWMDPARPRTCPDLSSVLTLQDLSRVYPPSVFERSDREPTYPTYQPWYTSYDQALETGTEPDQNAEDSTAYCLANLSTAIQPQTPPAAGLLPYATLTASQDAMTRAQDDIAQVENDSEEAAGAEDEWDLPYAKLIERALREAPGHRMVLQDIYEWFKQRRPAKCNDRTGGWKNSIRHNLSMNHAFVKTDHDQRSKDYRKGCVWVLANDALEEGVMSTTRFRNKNPTKRSTGATNPTRQAAGAKGGKAAKKSLGMWFEKHRASSPYARRVPITRSMSRSTTAHIIEPFTNTSRAVTPAVVASSPFPDRAGAAEAPLLHESRFGMLGMPPMTDFRFDDSDDVAALPEGASLFYDESESGEEPLEPRTPHASDDNLQPMFDYGSVWE